MLCARVAEAASTAIALDAATTKPPLLGGVYGRIDVTPEDLALATGAAYRTAREACRAGIRGVYVHKALEGLKSAPLRVLRAALGSLVTLALASWLVGLSTVTPEPLNHMLRLASTDAASARIFYELHAKVSPGHGPRVAYAGLPPIEEGSGGGASLLEVLVVAGETSIAYRDAVEGFPRATSFTDFPPSAAMLEALRVYQSDSGVARRRCGLLRRLRGRDAWLYALRGCSPGDVGDLAVTAAFFSTLCRLAGRTTQLLTLICPSRHAR